MARPKPGDPAPSFELLDQDGQRVRLAAYRGRKVLLVVQAWYKVKPDQTVPKAREALAGMS
jgi:hypothetical protein